MAATVELLYSLTEKEIYECLNASGVFQLSKKKLFIECAILLFLVVFLGYMCFTNFAWYYPVLMAVAFIFALVLVLGPKSSIRKQAKAMAGKEFKLRIMMEKLVAIDKDKNFEVKLDNSASHKIHKSNIIIVTKDNSVMIIPARAFPPERSGELQARIMSGTKEKKD